jgi:UDP-2,4-diacetamido-2,4,6-trideoxy-beta-L-altropyranose hydrolase
LTPSSNEPFAVFRADASPEIGGGHVMRCLTLADALSERGWRCGFACNEETLSVTPALAASSHPARAPEDLNAAWPEDCDLLVVDHYGLAETFEGPCRPWAKRILTIDDLADRSHDCDILLDQTFGRRPEDYDGLVPSNCLILTGSTYALLRPQFAEARPAALSRRRKNKKNAPLSILVAMGGSDPDNVTSLVLEGLKISGIAASVEVVLGPAAPYLEAVRAQAASMRPPVRVRVGVNDMASLMADADLAIGAVGTTSWERCCLGLPSAVMVIADNQRLIGENLQQAGATLALGQLPDVDAQAIANAVSRLCADSDSLLRMSQAAAAICDGEGARRVSKILDNMTA